MLWAGLVFILVTGLTYFLLLWLSKGERRVQRRLDRAVAFRVSLGQKELAAQQEQSDYRNRIRQWRERLAQRWAGGAGRSNLSLRLQRAGLPLRDKEFLLLNIAAAAGAGLLGLLVSGMRLSSMVFFLLIGAVSPLLYLRWRERTVIATLNGQIADALVLMSNSLKAGYSFLQAMEMVAREMPPPISREFSRALSEMSLGIRMEAALEAMGKRASSDDLDLVITAVLIQRQVGGNLSEVLDIIAETIRERVRIQGEIRTLTAQGRISGIIISLLPIAIGAFMFMISPDYIATLVRHPLGQVMLGVGVAGQVLGAIIIRKVVQIEV